MNRSTSRQLRQLKVSLCGLAAVGLLAAGAQGCSSSGTTSGTGGSSGTGTGGHVGGTGGGVATGTGGSAPGTGGSGGQLGCTSANTATAPTTGLIADFAGDGSAGVEIMGGVSTYDKSAAAPTATTAGGTLHIVENGVPGAAAQYVGTVVYFTGCVDASAFTGISFGITGTLTGCTMQFSINDSEHGDSSTGVDTKATGPKGSYAPQLGVAAPFAATVSVPFTGATAPMGGSPAAPVDPAKLIGVQWQFTIPAAPDAGAATNCSADLMIDNIMFYH